MLHFLVAVSIFSAQLNILGSIAVHQQINLFQPIFRKEKKHFSFITSVKVLLVFFVSLAVVYVYSWTKLHAVEIDLAAIKSQNSTQLAQMASITKQLNDTTGADSAEQHVDQLRSELKAGQFLISILGNIYSTHRQGFSGYLEGFSRKTISGMWITAFEMKNGGQSVMINGGTLTAELIPRFIDGLADESTLLGTHFETLEMKRTTAGNNWIEFWLSSGDFSFDLFSELE